MDPQTPTSFIPKRPIVSASMDAPVKNRAVGLLSLLTVIIVIATALSFVGVYFYQRSLVTDKTKLEESINDAKNGIGTDFLSDMKRLNDRITGVKQLLQTHIVVSPIFSALESTTLRSVQYKSFGYEFSIDSITKAEMVKVTIDGVAKNYSTIALQSDAYSQSPLIKNPVFSNLTVDEKGANVNFKLTFDVAPTDLSYQAFIDAKMKGTTPVPQSGVQSPQ